MKVSNGNGNLLKKEWHCMKNEVPLFDALLKHKFPIKMTTTFDIIFILPFIMSVFAKWFFKLIVKLK